MQETEIVMQFKTDIYKILQKDSTNDVKLKDIYTLFDTLPNTLYKEYKNKGFKAGYDEGYDLGYDKGYKEYCDEYYEFSKEE